MMHFKNGYFFGFIFAVLLGSCKNIEILDDFDRGWGDCYNMIALVEAPQPDTFDEEDFGQAFQDHFSEKSQVIANALNLKVELHNLLDSQSEMDDMRFFVQYQNIINRISLAELEISSLSAAIRCEEDNAKQLAWYLDRLESDRSSKRTVTSIILNASSNIIGGIIILWIANGNTTRQLIGVGASLTQIILNVISKAQSYGVVLEHDLNILEELYHDSKIPGKIIPPSVWYYFNEESNLSRDKSIRENLIQSWEDFNFLEDKELYLSEGGTYTSEQIRKRASMLDLFASYLSLMRQDLLLFRREVTSLIDI